MGGYAAYVWPAYAAVAVVMTGLVLASWRGLKAKEALLDSLRAAKDDGSPRDDDDS